MPRPPYKKPKRKAAATENARPSRSARKRASAAMQRLGEELANLRPGDRIGLNLPLELEEALAMYDTIKDHEGRRRQRQYIGRLMRNLDAEAIDRALRKFQDTQTHRIDWIPVAREEMEAILAAREEKVKNLVDDFLNDLVIPGSLPEITGETEQRMLTLARAARLEQQENKGATTAKAELFRMMADLLPR